MKEVPCFLTEYPDLQDKINDWFDEFHQNPKDETALHLIRLILLHYEKFPDIIESTILSINERLGIKPLLKDIL